MSRFYQGISTVRLPLDLTFAPKQSIFKYFPQNCSFNSGAISHGPRISHRVICAILHGPRISHHMMCAILHYPRISHEQLYGKYLNFDHSRANVKSKGSTIDLPCFFLNQWNSTSLQFFVSKLESLNITTYLFS